MEFQKHILIISLHADPMLPAGIGEYGGGHMYPYELLTGLSKENFKVSLITRKCDSFLPNVDRINEFTTIYRMDYGNFTFHDKRDFYLLKEISFSLACALLDQYHIQPDIIHSLYWNSGYLALQLSHKLHIPYVHSPISVGAVIKKKKTKDIEPHRIDMEQIVFENASVIFSITESEKKDIISYYGIDRAKIAIIGRPIAKEYLYPIHDEWGNVRNENMQYVPAPFSEEIKPMHLNENWWEKKAFVYVGRIHHNKGIHHIINAWIMLKKQYTDACPPLWIIGGTPTEINEFHLEHNLHLNLYEKNGSIIWWGRLNAEGISSLYTRAIALVMHSKYEPGGRVSIEAMSAALPVIATPCGFAVDTIIDWHTGFLINYGDEEKLAERMSMFILQPYLSSSMGYNAKKAAIYITSKWNFMEHHIKVYNQLISLGRMTHEEELMIIQNQWLWGIIHSYPTNLPEISEKYLRQKLSNIGIHNISKISKDNLDATEYFVWHIQNEHKTLSVLQPYDRINIRRLLDVNRYSKIVFSSTIYAKFKKWMDNFPSPVLFLDDEKQAIVMKSYSVIKYNVDNFTNIIRFITNYKHNISSQIQMIVGEILSKNFEMYETIHQYQSYIETLMMFSEGDFSLASEAEWILFRIAECSHLKNTLSSSLMTYLSELANKPSPKDIVLGGFVRPNSFCYCENKLCLLTPENLHPTEDGYDEGSLLLLTVATNTEIDFWHSLIQKIPKQTRQNAMLWTIIFLTKSLLLYQTMSIYPEKIGNIHAQLDLLLDIVSLK